MPDWCVNLIIGVLSVLLGFVGGFFTKTLMVKFSQKINKKLRQIQKAHDCSTIIQIGEINDEQ